MFMQRSDSTGSIPNLDNVLLISPSWDFTKSFVYCGRATERLGLVTHISHCGRMTVIYRHSKPSNTSPSFSCTYLVTRT